MKTLKLEVGKTYRSREGEEVKIVETINSEYHTWPFVGDNGEVYNEEGRYFSAKFDYTRDLIEEVPEPTRHTFNIPDGVKEIKVSQKDNCIIVEMVPEKEPKPGDVMVNGQESVYILKSVTDGGTHKHYAWLGRFGHLTIGGTCHPGRPATPEEAQRLWDALKKAGKRWNPETMQVEEIPEKEKIEKFLESYADGVMWSREQVCWLIEDYLKHREGEK